MTGGRSGSARQPVQDRAWETRVRLLRATIESLAEDGYAATTLGNVGARSGVSRGSMTHQFPTRLSLVIGAMEGITQTLRDDMLSRRELGEVGVDRAIETMWRHYDLPAFGAATEIMVAGRTEQALIPAIESFLARVVPTANQTLLVLLGFADRAGPPIKRMCAVLLDSMTLVAQSRDFSLNDPQHDPHLKLWKEHVRDALNVNG